MPPKRKRATDSEAPSVNGSVGTRRSTRKGGPQADDVPDDIETSTLKPAKKPRNTAKKGKAPEKADVNAEPTPLKSAKKSSDLDPQSFTPSRVSALFTKYADEDDSNTISAEGLEKLCTEAELSMEGPSPFLLAWLLKAKSFGALSKPEWENGLGQLRIDTIAKIRVAVSELESMFYKTLEKSAQIAYNPSTDPYDKRELSRIASNIPLNFRTFYLYCFTLAKKEEQRVMEMEMATAIWSVLLQSKYPIIEKFIEFINAHPNHRAVNKDVWSMTLEFCLAMQDVDLATYNDDESWPSILDEFVAWEKKRLSGDEPMEL